MVCIGLVTVCVLTQLVIKVRSWSMSDPSELFTARIEKKVPPDKVTPSTAAFSCLMRNVGGSGAKFRGRSASGSGFRPSVLSYWHIDRNT